MTKRRLITWLFVAPALLLLPVEGKLMAQGSCGPFTDVSASDVFCPFILQAFFTSVTQGTSPTTFSPNDLIPREQVVTFFDRVMDISLHRGTVRTAIGKTWAPTSTNTFSAVDVSAPMNDVVTDGTFLWIARNDGKILKVSAADRRLQETWSLAGSAIPRKLGLFLGLVIIADNQGSLQFFNPATTPAGTASTVLANAVPASNLAALAFDGTNVWMGNAGSPNLLIANFNTQQAATFNVGGNVDGMVFDGTNMWMLLANSSLLKLTVPALPTSPSALETLTIPVAVSDCRMLYDGNNIWIPTAGGNLFVIRPTLNLASLPSSIVTLGAIPSVGSPYVASFDGENIMIGGLTNGKVALYKSTSLTQIRTFDSGATGIRGIANDGKSFTIADAVGTKFFQY